MPSPSHLRKLLGPALVTLLIAAVLTVAAPAGGSTGDNVLVVGDTWTGSARNMLEQRLEEVGHTVTNTVGLPADLGGYDSIWWVSLAGLSAADRAALVAFVRDGGGLHLSGERDCCVSQRDAIRALVHELTGDDTVQIGGLGTFNGPFTFNSVAAGGISVQPNQLSHWAGSSVGGLGQVSGSNVFVTDSTGTVVGAVWAAEDLVAAAGRLSVLMDITWLENHLNADVQIIENIQAFLTGEDEAAENTAPEVQILAPAAGDVVEVGDLVSVVAEVIDPDPGDSHTCTVSWGDGTQSDVSAVDGACTASRAYDVAGAYDVVVTATDAAGEWGSASVEVVVVDTAVTITGGGSLEGRAAPFNVSVRYRPGAVTPQGEVRMRTPHGDVRTDSLAWVVAGSDGSYALVAGTASVGDGPPRPFRLLIVPGQRGSASLALTWADDEGPSATVGPLGVQSGSIQLRR